MNKPVNQLIASEVVFFSPHDEDAFFEWLDKLDCIVDCRGQGAELLITLKEGLLNDNSLRELLALFNRYDVGMSQLAAFETDSNRLWFRDSRAYWYKKVFLE